MRARSVSRSLLSQPAVFLREAWAPRSRVSRFGGCESINEIYSTTEATQVANTPRPARLVGLSDSGPDCDKALAAGSWPTDFFLTQLRPGELLDRSAETDKLFDLVWGYSSMLKPYEVDKELYCRFANVSLRYHSKPSPSATQGQHDPNWHRIETLHRPLPETIRSHLVDCLLMARANMRETDIEQPVYSRGVPFDVHNPAMLPSGVVRGTQKRSKRPKHCPKDCSFSTESVTI